MPNHPEDAGSRFFSIISVLLLNYMTTNPRRW